MYSRDTDVGWIWVENDLRVVMDSFGFPVVVRFTALEFEFSDFDIT